MTDGCEIDSEMARQYHIIYNSSVKACTQEFLLIFIHFLIHISQYPQISVDQLFCVTVTKCSFGETTTAPLCI